MYYQTKQNSIVSTLLVYYCFLSTTIVRGHLNPCGVLFGENDASYSLEDGAIVANFNEEYVLDKIHPWIVSKSGNVISENCDLTLCPQTYLKGNCTNFKNKTNVTLSKNVQSASCQCKVEPCTCKQALQAKIRKSSCGVAYIGNGGCNSCHPKYVEMKGASASFPEEFSKAMNSLKIKHGCELTIFDKEDYDGQSLTATTNMYNVSKDFTIKSYECSCNEEENSASQIESTSTLFNLPEKLSDLQFLHKTRENSVRIQAALESAIHKRSHLNAYILLLGSTGSGKSSLINLLFDNPKISNVGVGGSVTSDILEFQVQIPLPSLGINNSQLRLIDTPGLSDSRGPERDARFLATLEDYFEKHEELNDRIPNIILVCHKFTDNRFSGPGSNFVKTLRALNSLKSRITDSSYSNVIFLFTHFLSELPQLQKNPEERLKEFKNVIEEYSLFPNPIILVPGDNKPEANGMFMVANNYVFLSGEHFPANLFRKIITATKMGKDPLGQAIFEEGLINGRLADVDPKTKITQTGAILLPSDHAKIQKYREHLAATLFEVEDSPISRKLAEVYNTTNSLSKEIKAQFPETLPYLQKALSIRNIRNLENIPRTNLAIAQLFSELRTNAAVLKLLEAAFSLNPPKFSGAIPLGKHYNLEHESVSNLHNNVFEPFSGFTLSQLGYQFPSNIAVKYEQNIKSQQVFKVFNNRNELINQRLKDFRLPQSFSAQLNLSSVLANGYNVVGNTLEFDSSEEYFEFDEIDPIVSLVGVRHYKIFQLDAKENWKLSQSFISRLDALPNLNLTSYENVEGWKNFFKTHGSNIVVSAVGGGSILVKIKFIRDLVGIINPELIFEGILDFKSSTLPSPLIIEHELEFFGGDTALHTKSFKDMTIDRISSHLSSWQQSLLSRPAILPQKVRLVPLDRLGQLSQSQSEKLSLPLSLFINNGLKYNDTRLLQKLETCRAVEISNRDAHEELLRKILSQIEEVEQKIEEEGGKSAAEVGKQMVSVFSKTIGKSILQQANEKIDEVLEERSKCHQNYKLTRYPY